MNLANLMALPADGLTLFMLLITRFGAMFIGAPIFSNVQVPVRFRVGLALMMAIVLLPFELGRVKQPHVDDLGELVIALAGEMAVGLILGFIAMLVFHGIQFAGYMVGLQMGFGMDQLYDPNTGGQVTSLALFLSALATVTFLLMDGHHFLILALEHSLQVVPPGAYAFGPRTMDGILVATSGLFTIVFTLLLPILGILLLAEVALAIMNRVMPQFNVFVAGFPIKIALGFFTLIMGLPLMASYFVELFTRLGHQLNRFFG